VADARLRNADLAKAHDVRLRTPQGIMPALDVDSFDEVKRVVARTTRVEGVVAYKVGLTSVLRLGLAAVVRELRAVTDLPLIYDHQKAGPDVPDMAAKFAALCKEAGADGLILFPVAGPRAVAEFVGNALKHRLLPVVGGDLPLPDYNVAGGGYIADDALARIFERAVALRTDHFVVPATDLAKVRRLAAWLVERLEVPFLFMPGIGALGGAIKDAFAAAPGCRRYAVVGRAVYGAPDPSEAAKRLAGEALAFA
jgi:orotidine-5'-phosphate decarboxylase